MYQIYPRSYQDSDNDGTGDLKGIESRLDYFVELGVDAIWLSPIYKSPMKDFGYDISDFRDVDPIFGTLDDFKSLLSSAHQRNIKVIMDFVPNHSSDEHEWFLQSLAKQEPYTDYYVWADPKGFDENGDPIPPCNWVSVFRNSAWEYREERGQFYLHQFVVGQPDLNYRNTYVVDEMKDVLRFWLDLGVDGFRMDAVVHIWEDVHFYDEPESGNPDVTDPNDYGYYNHIYTANLPETREILGQFHQLIKSYAETDGHDRVNMLEVYLSPQDIQPYFEVSDYPFNFGLIGFYGGAKADWVLNSINEWLNNLPEGKIANWVLGNHDNWRIGSRVGPEMMDAFNMITLTLPGVAVTYQGEEIGMINTEISYEDTVDPAGCNCGPDHFNDPQCSRDPERTPMQWSGTEKNAGFSDADKTWLPVNPNFDTVNVESEKARNDSHLNVYKALVKLRYSDPAFEVGGVKGITRDNVLAFSRTYDQAFYPTYVTVVNFNDQDTTVDLFGEFNSVVESGAVLVSTSGSQGNNPVGTIANLRSLTMGPSEGIVLYLVEVINE